MVGYLGELSDAGRGAFDLQGRACLAELRLDVLAGLTVTRATYIPPPTQPAVDRDLNLVLPESVRWADVAETVRQHGTALLENITYRETYRDPQKDGADRKRCLFSLRFRASDRTLTGEEVDSICQKIVAGCQSDHAAVLLGSAGMLPRSVQLSQRQRLSFARKVPSRRGKSREADRPMRSQPQPKARLSVGQWGTDEIAPGEARDLFLNVGESYSGMTVRIPLHVVRGRTTVPRCLSPPPAMAMKSMARGPFAHCCSMGSRYDRGP